MNYDYTLPEVGIHIFYHRVNLSFKVEIITQSKLTLTGNLRHPNIVCQSELDLYFLRNLLHTYGNVSQQLTAKVSFVRYFLVH